MGVGSSQREHLVDVIVAQPEPIDPSNLLFARLHSAADGSSKYMAWDEPQTIGLLADDIITVSVFRATSERDFDRLYCEEFAEVYLPWVDIGHYMTDSVAMMYELGIRREDSWLGSTASPSQYRFAFARAYNRAKNNPTHPRLKVGIRLWPRHCWDQKQSPLDEPTLFSTLLKSTRGLWKPVKEIPATAVSSPAVLCSMTALTPEEQAHMGRLQTQNEHLRSLLGLQAAEEGPAVDDQVQEHVAAMRRAVSENYALRAEMQAADKELAVLEESMFDEQHVSIKELATHDASASSGDTLPQDGVEDNRIKTEMVVEMRRVFKDKVELVTQYEQKIQALEAELMAARQAHGSAREISCSSSSEVSFQRAAFELQSKGEELEVLEGECKRLGYAIAHETDGHQEEHVAFVRQLMIQTEVQNEEIDRLEQMLHRQRAPAPPMTGELNNQVSILEAELQQAQHRCAQQQQAAEQHTERLRRETLELEHQVLAVQDEKEVAAAEVELQRATPGTASVVEQELSVRENLDNELSRLMHKIEVFDEKIRKLNENAADIRERASQVLSSVPERTGSHDPDVLRVEELELAVNEQQYQMELLRRDEAKFEEEREKAVKDVEARKAELGAIKGAIERKTLLMRARNKMTQSRGANSNPP
mmetsp:Transcript_36624/g.72429  ORF Transcript_36624/g.72429 Transcript_36624/m.72429 type:complete len:648 (+) Transcript_36624:120-2063(+)